MKTIVKSLLVILTAVSVVGCATIVSRSSWPLTVNTNPNGAQVEITDRNGLTVFKGSAPATVKLNSGAGFFVPQRYNIKISQEGYEEKIVTVSCTINGWYLGNVIFGGLIGLLIVDPLSGAMYRLETNLVNVNLDQKATSERTLQIIDINDLPQEYRKHLIAL